MNQKNWYYNQAGRMTGPMSEENLTDLLKNKTIPPDTVIWRQGMDNWQPASEVFADDSPQSPAQQNPLEPSGHNIKKTPVILVIALSIITFGIYNPFWFISRLEALNALQTRRKLTKNIFKLPAVLLVISFFLFFVVLGLMQMARELENIYLILFAKSIDLLDNILILVSTIILLIKAFDVRSMLRQHFNEHLGQNIYFSAVFTFLFPIYYLQYKINRLFITPDMNKQRENLP